MQHAAPPPVAAAAPPPVTAAAPPPATTSQAELQSICEIEELCAPRGLRLFYNWCFFNSAKSIKKHVKVFSKSVIWTFSRKTLLIWNFIFELQFVSLLLKNFLRTLVKTYYLVLNSFVYLVHSFNIFLENSFHWSFKNKNKMCFYNKYAIP